MDKIGKILAPTDLSEFSKAGVRHALEMASSQGAEVIVYHVIAYEEATRREDGSYLESLAKLLPQVRKELLAEFLTENFADILPKVKIKQLVEIGVPYRKIVERATTEAVDMIVMCTHGRMGLSHFLMGSVTEKVVRTSPCPVLSIHPPLKDEAAERAEAVA